MEIVTVGVYIIIEDRFLFVFGPNPQNDRLAILRVGGHREGDETPWECAVREALEETGLTIELVEPEGTLLWLRGPAEAIQPDLAEPIPWEGPGPRPLLVLPRGDGTANVMFLAQATGTPSPCNEVRGLLLLTREEVFALSRRSTTLQEFLDAGGQAWMRSPYPPDMPLEPALQFRVLATLLDSAKELNHRALPGCCAGTSPGA